MDNYQIYEAQADTISVDDIARNTNNRFVLRRIKRNNANESHDDVLYIQNQHDIIDEDEDEDVCVDYVPECSHDMGGWVTLLAKMSI